MLATVVWIGGLATLAILVLPLMRRILKPGEFSNWLTVLNKRLDPIGWFSLGLLTFTGLIQMDSNPNYVGLLAVSNPWSQAIFIKHIAFIGMIAISAYSTWSIGPALQRAAWQRASGSVIAERAQDRLQTLIQINLILGILVLVLTAVARIS
jgi:putative copper export protein